jgi:hypothetical protein
MEVSKYLLILVEYHRTTKTSYHSDQLHSISAETLGSPGHSFKPAHLVLFRAFERYLIVTICCRSRAPASIGRLPQLWK